MNPINKPTVCEKCGDWFIQGIKQRCAQCPECRHRNQVAGAIIREAKKAANNLTRPE